jgi:ribosomal protein L7/L12
MLATVGQGGENMITYKGDVAGLRRFLEATFTKRAMKMLALEVSVSFVTPGPEKSKSEQALDECVPLALSGRKIDAIKLIRERTSMGLKESKDLYETRWPPAAI